MNVSLVAALTAGLKNAGGGPITGQTPQNAQTAAMKIDPNSAPPAVRKSSGGEMRATEAVAATGNRAGEATLLSLRPDAGSAAPVDQARVAELRSALVEGRYQPSGAAIAERMLQLESDFQGVR